MIALALGIKCIPWRTPLRILIASYWFSFGVGVVQWLSIHLHIKPLTDYFAHLMYRQYINESSVWGGGRPQFLFAEPSYIGMHLFGVLLPLMWLMRGRDHIYAKRLRNLIVVYAIGSVLMQAGKIQQAGPPVELYRRPVDASVAAFFGSPNLLRADVLASASDQGRCNAELQIGQWQGRCTSPVALQPLQQALVVARPEDIRLAAPGQPQDAGDLVLEASVTDTVFRGGRATVVLDASGLVLKAEVPALQTPAIGERMQAVIPLQAMWCVPAGT